MTVKKGQDKAIIVINTYRPPSGNPVCFLASIEELMDRITGTRYLDIALLGDLNLDHSKGKMCIHTKKLQYILNTHNLYQVITSPTRQTATTKSIIDVIYIKTNKKVSPFVLKTHISDHYLAGCVRYLDYHPDPKTHFRGRSYKNYTFQKATEFYQIIDRDYIFDCNDVDMVWNYLAQIITLCADKLCPYCNVSTKTNQPQWISNAILEKIADRDSAFKEAFSVEAGITKDNLLKETYLKRLKTED